MIVFSLNLAEYMNRPKTECSRCQCLADCRDVLGDGTQVCFECATESEKQDYARRVVQVNNLEGVCICGKCNPKAKPASAPN